MVLNLSIFLFTALLLRGLLKWFVLSYRGNTTTPAFIKFTNSFVSLLSVLLDTLYVFFVALCFMTMWHSNDKNLYDYTLCTLIVCTYTIFGVVDLCEKICFFIVILCSLPYYTNLIIKESRPFFLSYGISKDLIDCLPYSLYSNELTKQSKFECINCLICCYDFQDNEKCLLLKCEHLYHLDCLKDWLQEKYICPLCRSTDIF